MGMFLRQTTIGRVPLAVSMCGVRLGERVLQIGLNDPAIMAHVAAATGLTGQAELVVSDEKDAKRACRATAETGAAVETRVVSSGSLPFDEATFDVAVIHNRDGLLGSPETTLSNHTIRECHRVLRPGGRVMAIEEGSPSGLLAWFRPHRPVTADRGTVAALAAAGFRAVRAVADREGYRFIEGTRP
jgi:SAM-dependent methyltransferase